MQNYVRGRRVKGMAARWTSGTVLVVSMCVFVGCGSELAEVKGRVTLDGESLGDATIMFFPEGGGRPGSAMTNSDGDYELSFTGTRKGALIGKNQVSISTYYPPIGATNEDGTYSQTPARPERLPKRYHENSELSVEVKPGVPSYDFELQSK